MMVMQRLAGKVGVVMMVRSRRSQVDRMSRVVCAKSVADVARDGRTEDDERKCEGQQTPNHLGRVYPLENAGAPW
jgi:hypothetical protein